MQNIKKGTLAKVYFFYISVLSQRVLSFSGHEGREEILERIAASKADSLSLLFPRNTNIFQQKTDLQILRDEVEKLGKDITIITLNAKARHELQSMGIAALPSLTDKEKTPFEEARNLLSTPSIAYIPIDQCVSTRDSSVETPEVNPFLSKPTLHALFILSAIAFLLFVFIFHVAIPGAVVSISPHKDADEMHIKVEMLDNQVYTETELWERNHGMFVEPLESVFTHSGRFTNISKEFHGENATGLVQLVNNSDTDITLKKGTRLQHDNGVVIQLPSWEKISAQSSITISLTLPGVDAYGSIIGERGNFTKDTLFSIPGLPDEMQKEIFARVDTAFTGGESAWKYKIAEEDFEKALQQWEEESRDKIEPELTRLLSELSEEKGSEYRSVTGVLDVLDFEILESSFAEDTEVLLGKEQGYIEGSIKVRMKTYAYSVENLVDLIILKYQKRAPDGMVLTSVNTDLLHSQIQKMNAEKNSIESSFSTSGLYQYSLEPKSDRARLFLMDAKKMILGEHQDMAREMLINNFVEISEVEIQLSPFWVRNLPLIPEKIHFEIAPSD